MLQPGTKAPDFHVKTHEGNTVSLADFRGRKVVLWFYPKADTPGCTKEGRALGDQFSEFQSRGVQILGCSFDTVSENKAFADKFAFPYPLLCDTDRALGLAYGACDSASDRNARRISYIIDEEGRIAHALPQVDPTTHSALLLQLLS